jgi:hypothetical protein
MHQKQGWHMSGRDGSYWELQTHKGVEEMANSENGNQQGREADPAGQPLPDKQAMALEQVSRFQRDIEGQGQQVARTLTPIAEALDKGGNVSLEMMGHVKAHILLAHLQLDELEQWLTLIGYMLPARSSRSIG